MGLVGISEKARHLTKGVKMQELDWDIGQDIQDRFFEFCKLAGTDEEVFRTFRKIDIMQLTISSLENPIGTACWDKAMCEIGIPVPTFVFEIDKIGDPMMERRLDGQMRSREMTRWMYLFHDMLRLFGKVKSVIEVGGGFGAMAALFCRSMDIDYTIVDTPNPGLLQKRFTKECGVEITIIPNHDFIDQLRPSYDLMIAHYSIDEFKPSIQESYLPIVERCRHGYFTSKGGSREQFSAILPIQNRRMAPDGFDYAEIMYW